MLIFVFFSGGLSAIAIVRIKITDVNDNSPIFEPLYYNVTLRSDSLVNEAIVRLRATDLDDGLFGQVAYRISSGNEAGIFRIDKSTGEIHVARPSLLSRSSLYQLNVTGTDAAGLKSTHDALLRINTITSTNQRRLPSCERSRYVLTVKENSIVNGVIGTIKEFSGSTNPGKFLHFSFAFVVFQEDIFLYSCKPRAQLSTYTIKKWNKNNTGFVSQQKLAVG